MKILHIGKYFSPFRGGVETYLLDVMNAQVREGHEVAALVHNHERSLGLERSEMGKATVWRAGTLMTAFFTPISPGFRGALRRLIREFQPDIVHAHLPNPSACWLLTLREMKALPLVLHWHSDVLTDGQGAAMRTLYRAYRPFEHRLLEQADAIVATSESYLATSASLQDFPDKCHVVPLGLDAERFLASAEVPELAIDQGDGTFEVLAIGRLTYYKGFGFLIRAVAELEDVSLHIVGEGALRDELWQLARELETEDRVHFHGGLEDDGLAARLASCACVCLPSIERTEAFGLVLLEAMAFGRATVSSRVHGSGMSWVVEDEVTGLMTPPRDVEALAHALARLRDDPALAARLGAAGRQRFLEHFAIEPSSAALTRVYESVLPAGDRP
ncbi:MAG: glycosyltransferase [Xanthomonadales bacterium]|nr:glycosyltransferase [Xanthomonadales bacterium]